MVHPTDHDERFGPATVLRVLRRRVGVLLACAVIVPAVALAYSLSQQKQYQACSSLLFRDPAFDQKLFGSTVFAPATDPAREAATNVKLVSLEVVAARTARALGGGVAPGTVSSEVTVSSEGQSDVASICATDPSPALAARMSNTFAQQYIAFRRNADRSKIASAQRLVQTQLDRLPVSQKDSAQGRQLRDRAEQLQILASLQTGNAELVQRANTPTSPSSPKPVRNTVLGLLFGVLLGIGLALLLERVDRRLKDPKEIADLFDRPILGAVPESRTIATADPNPRRLGSGEAEAFRMLRANLRYFNVDRKISSVLITSSSPGDGKSTVAMHLASAAAAAGDRVALVEADLRQPTLARRLGLPLDRGLSQLLAGQASSIQEVAHRATLDDPRRDYANPRTMDVIVSGPLPPNPTDLIESERMRELIHEAESEYDLVVIDSPPTSIVSDAIPLVKEVSGVIVVSRLGKTTREALHTLRNQLANLEANTLGVVINSVGRQSGYYGYGYAYGYGYSAAEERPRRRRRDARPPSMELADRANGAPKEPKPEPEPEPERANVDTPARGNGAGSGDVPATWTKTAIERNENSADEPKQPSRPRRRARWRS